jgi:NhaP-type Na+/H+ or K+/H+ antiporter
VSVALWCLLIGVLLVGIALASRLLSRLFLSSAIVYLAVGYALGPGALGVIVLDPIRSAPILERVAEGAVLISLFTVGLRLGDVPWRDRRWRLPLRLAFVSMALSVALIAGAAAWGFGLSLGAAVLLGGILAPTDPVLASGVQAQRGSVQDKLRFSLAAEGGLNDGTAFPLVMLGLGLLGRHDFGPGTWRFWAVDVLWATLGGLLIGAALGWRIGKLVVYLRTRYAQAVGLDEFLSLGLIAVTYGAAQLCLASGFLAVFAAGLSLQRVKERPRAGTVPLGPGAHEYAERATHSHHASATMSDAVHDFNEQLEKLAELGLVLLVGAMLHYTSPRAELLWFVPLLFLVLRPFAVLVGTLGHGMTFNQRAMIGWFGIRGIGSVFYLMFAIRHGVTDQLARDLVTLTLLTVAVSIVVHGVSAGPLLSWYLDRRSAGEPES